jgi:hypothetical protein
LKVEYSKKKIRPIVIGTITGRKHDAVSNFLLRLRNQPADVSPQRIEPDRYVPLQLIAADPARSLFQLHGGEIRQWNQCARLIADPNITDSFDTVPVLLWEPHHQLKPLLAFVDTRRDVPTNGSGYDLSHISHIDPMPRNLAAVDINREVGLAE